MINRRRLVSAVLVAVAALAFPKSSAGGDPITEPEIVEMLSAEISEAIVLAKIEADGCICATSAQSIADLKRVGASHDLIFRLIQINGEQQPDDPTNTAEIIDMLDRELAEDLILARIQAEGCTCDTSGESIIALTRAGASEDLVLTLIQISGDLD